MPYISWTRKYGHHESENGEGRRGACLAKSTRAVLKMTMLSLSCGKTEVLPLIVKIVHGNTRGLFSEGILLDLLAGACMVGIFIVGGGSGKWGRFINFFFEQLVGSLIGLGRKAIGISFVL